MDNETEIWSATRAKSDTKLKEAKEKGFVPQGCLLHGEVVWAFIESDKCPCKGCFCPREKCGSTVPWEMIL